MAAETVIELDCPATTCVVRIPASPPKNKMRRLQVRNLLRCSVAVSPDRKANPPAGAERKTPTAVVAVAVAVAPTLAPAPHSELERHSEPVLRLEPARERRGPAAASASVAGIRQTCFATSQWPPSGQSARPLSAIPAQLRASSSRLAGPADSRKTW